MAGGQAGDDVTGPNSLPYVLIIPPVNPPYIERANFGTHTYTPEWDCQPHMCIIPAGRPCEHGVRWEFTSPERGARQEAQSNPWVRVTT